MAFLDDFLVEANWALYCPAANFSEWLFVFQHVILDSGAPYIQAGEEAKDLLF